MKLIFSLILTSLAIASARPKLPKENANLLYYYYFPAVDKPTNIVYNNTESLTDAKLKPNTKTLFFIDGFTAVGITPMHIEMIHAFSGGENYNVIAVDWQAYSGFGRELQPPEQGLMVYLDVLLVQIPKAAEDLAEFIEFISLNNDISYDDITLVGLSLGCHTAGAAGRATISKYNKPVGRVIGLDPALQLSEFDSHARIGKGDAKVVEIYNTNSGELGDVYPQVGDLSIYVNGGNFQPCDNSPLCHSHIYAFKLYGYLARNNTVKACPCKGAMCKCHGCSFECGKDAIVIGPDTPEEARGSYHVKTGYLDWS